MQNYDNDILLQNIKKLMTDNGITQAALADILGMSQSNVSKALSSNDKKNFTLDQLAGISKHFKVSIDVLIGNQQVIERDLSPRAVAEYFVRLIEQGDVEIIKHPVEEEIFEPYYDYQLREPAYHQYKKNIEYYAFYFPAYWHMPSGLDYEEESEMFAEMTQTGNDTIHCKTNTFFRHFLEIYNLYKQKALEEDTYRTVITDLLSHLRD